MSNNINKILGLLAVWALVAVGSSFATESFPLKDYVYEPDDAFKIKSVTEVGGEPGTKLYRVEFDSLSWRSVGEVNRQVWSHNLMLAIPDDLQSDSALLVISGGRNAQATRQGGNFFGSKQVSDEIAVMTKSIVAELQMIPNQPIQFHGDGVNRKEDDLIAYSWARYIETLDSRWLAQFPMTKAAVRGLDVVTTLAKSLVNVEINKFVVTGASKRGWTTWLTGAVDDRVVGIAPIVIDVLNMVPSMQHHYDSLGLWSNAIVDYVNHGVMARLHSPEVRQLAELIDPIYLTEHLTEPKFIINSANDEFFLPDSGQFYLDKLAGETHVRYVPNSGHFVNNFDAINSIIIFYDSVTNNKEMPAIIWSRADEWSLDFQVKGNPEEIILWQAVSPNHRDYRFSSDMPRYLATKIEINRTGDYELDIQKPEVGYKAFFVEVRYPTGPLGYLKLTTDIKVSKRN